MRIAVVGTGYVGLVTGTCLAESGNNVSCVDIDQAKVAGLKKGILPIYEPGLKELVDRNIEDGRLEFTTSLAEGLDGAQVVFIAVGTPQRDDGSANLTALFAVVDQIRETAKDPKLVVVKSTVPVGTNAEVHRRLVTESNIKHDVASNPEFLKEGYAVEDFMKPDRVVAGVRTEAAAEILRQLHAPFLRSENPFITMLPESSEMTKYVANAMLATKISFINEMANLCEKLHADINDVRRGIGHDRRIGFQFLFPGAGYGGSCFPKDVRAMIALAEQNNLEPRMLRSVDEINEAQKERLFEKTVDLLGKDGLDGKTVAIWGLAFKPRTDDIREAPALVLARQLLESGCALKVHDPEAMDNVQAELGDQLTYCQHPYDALDNADALVVVTEWQEFRNPDFDEIKKRLKGSIVIDGRNLYQPEQMAALGFTYASIGRETVSPADVPASAEG